MHEVKPSTINSKIILFFIIASLLFLYYHLTLPLALRADLVMIVWIPTIPLAYITLINAFSDNSHVIAFITVFMCAD